jgi:DNA-binding CsgD family transcriptional regulator
MTMDDKLAERLIERLDTLIKLQAANLSSRYSTAKEKILFLSSAGLPPKAIAELLGTSPNFVSVTLSKARKAKKGTVSSAGDGDEDG